MRLPLIPVARMAKPVGRGLAHQEDHPPARLDHQLRQWRGPHVGAALRSQDLEFLGLGDHGSPQSSRGSSTRRRSSPEYSTALSRSVEISSISLNASPARSIMNHSSLAAHLSAAEHHAGPKARLSACLRRCAESKPPTSTHDAGSTKQCSTTAGREPDADAAQRKGAGGGRRTGRLPPPKAGTTSGCRRRHRSRRRHRRRRRAAATVAAAVAAAAAARLTLFGDVDLDGPATEIGAVQGGLRGLRLFGGAHLDEAEALRTARVAIVDQRHGVDRAMRREQRLDRGFGGVVREIAHVQLRCSSSFPPRMQCTERQTRENETANGRENMKSSARRLKNDPIACPDSIA